jgi:hypothetical protein
VKIGNLNPQICGLNILMVIPEKYIAMMGLHYMNCSSLSHQIYPIHLIFIAFIKTEKETFGLAQIPVGVCRYDGKSFEWITEEDVTEFRNEGANGVRSITEDKNGDFWFNTEYRYSVYDSITLKSNKFYTRHESIGGLDGKIPVV